MLGKQAKIFSARNVKKLLTAAGRGRLAERDKLIVLLAVYAGLRACEIAQLTWGMVLDADHRVGHVIDVRGSIAKRGAGRRIPMHESHRKTRVRASLVNSASGRACFISTPASTARCC